VTGTHRQATLYRSQRASEPLHCIVANAATNSLGLCRIPIYPPGQLGGVVGPVEDAGRGDPGIKFMGWGKMMQMEWYGMGILYGRL
jgi:hypothetical protein